MFSDVLLEQPGFMVIQGEEYGKEQSVDFMGLGAEHALAEDYLAVEHLGSDILGGHFEFQSPDSVV